MIIAVDFDGTLCRNAWPEIGTPRLAVIEYVKQQKEGGAKLILWTNRTGQKLQDAIDWCYKYGIQFDAANENLPEAVQKFGGECRKVFADVYIDDKALHPDEIERQMRHRRTVRRGK